MVVHRELAETAGCLCLASRRAARTITRAFDRELRAHGVRATQFTLLAILELKGPQSIGDLARKVGADRTTLTRNLALVAEQGFVRMREGEDARSRIVTITPKGRAILQAAFATWRKVQAGLTDTIGSQAAESLRRLSRAAQA
jgi:DNA-binding MarR family transcriptional regulator